MTAAANIGIGAWHIWTKTLALSPGAMELVAMELKAQGLFMARSLSYEVPGKPVPSHILPHTLACTWRPGHATALYPAASRLHN
jgi:hypothetical protein